MKGMNIIQLNTLHLNVVPLNGKEMPGEVVVGGGEVVPVPPTEPETPDVPDVPVEPKKFILSASVANGVVSATLNGVVVSLPYTANEGDTIVLEVTPNDGYTFEGWADGNTDNPRSITMTADVVLSAECVEVVAPPVGNYIQFEDPAVEAICVANWSSDGIGLTEEDAAAVTDIGNKFNSNTEITSFEELRYFTGLTYISGGALASSAFRNCVNLKKIVIPRNVTNVKDYAMDGCSSLEDVIFEDADKITTIGTYAFRSTKATGELSFPNLETIYEGAYVATKVKKLVNLGKITSLKGGGLYTGIINNNSEVEFVDIPQSVTSIDAYYFARCYNLATIICRPTTPPSLGANFLYNVSWQTQTTIYVPDASLEAYKTAVNWSAYADRIHPLSEIEGGHITTFEGLIGAYTFEGRSNEDADRDIVEDKSGYNNTLTLKSMQWGFIHDNLPDLIREGFWDDALWISQSGYGEIVLPKGLTDFTVIAKRFVYSTSAGRNWSPLVGTGKSSGKGLFWFEYVDDSGRYTNQANGLKYTLSSLESEITWMTNTHYNGHRLTGTQDNNVHDGMVYINKFRGDVGGTKIQKIYAIYLFNRQLSPSEIEAFIKEKIDDSYVLPTIEQ